MIYSSLLSDVSGRYNLEGLGEVVQIAVKKLLPHRTRFDSITVTGLSGVVVGTPVALALDVPLVIVRKPQDGSHHAKDYSEPLINQSRLGARTLWLDDFVSSGETRARIAARVQPLGADVVGEYLYADGDWYADTWAARAALTLKDET